MVDPGTLLAFIAFADKCLSYGKKFAERCQSYLNADQEATELLIAIESNWIKMETQIRLMKNISGSLDKPLLDIQSRILSQLEGKLKTATLTIDRLMKDKKEATKTRSEPGDSAIASMIQDIGILKPSKKLKYVFQKSSLYQIVDDIEKWQARYDPTWFIIMRKPINVIDETLLGEQERPSNKHVPIILAAKGIRYAMNATAAANDDGVHDPIWMDQLALQPSLIPHSTVQRSALAGDSNEEVLIDTVVSHADADAGLTRNAVRHLACVLAQVDPCTFGLLKCKGVVRPKGGSNLAVPQSAPIFKFIFSIPPKLTEPKSLREVLLSKVRYPLDEQLGLAKKMANSVLFVQTADFVHKNIRPETIIVFKDKHSDIGAPFLVGFEQFRVGGGRTYRVGDGKWEHNLYRHPSRQGTRPDVDYRMRHDIYSLGVVLLEIGVWKSFLVYDEEEKSCFSRPHDILGSINVNSGQNAGGSVRKAKEVFETLAEEELPSRLGKRYTEVVLRCLRCLDYGHGADADADVGVHYIDDIIEEIHAITL